MQWAPGFTRRPTVRHRCAYRTAAYHRWAQDMRRSHFGLRRRGDVDLRVEWPSGAVQTFARVATNRLYRITEGSGIAAVTPGVAPVYPCGPPPLNGAVDTGIFLWRDCPSGEWRLKDGRGRWRQYSLERSLRSGDYTSVKGVALESKQTS